MFNEFVDLVAVVTGAGNGIGKSCAKAFGKEKAIVYTLDISFDGAKQTAEEIIADGGKAVPMKIDITDEENVRKVFEDIIAAEKKVDCLVNSAGVIGLEKFDVLDCKAWDRVVNVDLRGTFFCSKYAGIQMREQKSGSIVNIGAGGAKTGGMNVSAAYVSAKGGVNSLTWHFANQLSQYGVRCNCICPGPIDTQMMDAQVNMPGVQGDGKANMVASVPLGLGYPSDIAYGVLYLSSPVTGRYITGEILDINGGLIKD